MLLRDPKLRLALIDEVYSDRSDADSWVSAYRRQYEALSPPRSWSELEENDGEHVPELEQLLAALPLTADDLSDIEHLTLDGDRDLYGWVYPSWWDFGDHFTIHDLSGLEQCASLEYLSLGQGLVEGASLAPLSGLSGLTRLSACALCNLRDVSALLEIPSLRTLEVVNVATSDQRSEWERVIAQLRARG
jgi:hypothetical protein